MAVWVGNFAPEPNYRLVEKGAMALTIVPQSRIEVCALVRDAAKAFAANERPSAKPRTHQLGLFEA
jgi:hypothetical protein